MLKMEEEIGFVWYLSFGLHEVQIETRYLERSHQGSQFEQGKYYENNLFRMQTM